MQNIDSKTLAAATDETGQLRVWDVFQKQWVRRHLVDAREGLSQGSLSLVGPAVDMVGPAGAIAVPADLIETYRANGYQLVAASTDESSSGTEASSDPSNANSQGDETTSNGATTPRVLSDEEKAQLAALSRKDLRQMAEAAGIADAASLGKPELLAALGAS